jgi:hypothetical protein
LALAVAAACPRYATALFVTLLTRNLHQWQEELRLGAFVMWGVGVVVHIGKFQITCAPFTLASDATQGARSTTPRQGGHAGNSLERLFYGGGDSCERRSISGL